MGASRIQWPLAIVAVLGVVVLNQTAVEGTPYNLTFGLIVAAYLAANVYFERRARRLRRERN